MKNMLKFSQLITYLIISGSIYAADIEYVTNTNAMGDGTLANAINKVNENGIIIIDSSLSGKTITPTILSSINSCTIKGNGIILSLQNWQFHIGSEKNVVIERVHFTKGDGTNGGAIANHGNLTLHSCIFSNNDGYFGGAIYNKDGGNLTVLGCTFWNNKASGGGAIYSEREYNGNTTSTTLIGNIFYGNTANYGNVFYNFKGIFDTQYNIYDNTSFDCTTGYTTGKIFNFSGTGDFEANGFLLSANFLLTSDSQALEALATIPSGYPDKDFYGNTIIAPASAGAVQSIVDCINPNIEYDSNIEIAGGVVFKYKGQESHVSVPYGTMQIGHTIFYERKINGGFTIYDDNFTNNYAFIQQKNLTSVDLPCTLGSIGDFAFFSCTELTDLTLPEHLSAIGDVAFGGVGFTSLNIPNSVKSIGKSAFYYCVNLQTIILPSELNKIEDFVFDHCTELSSVNIPENVSSIGLDAFAFCTSLASIELPKSLISIGIESFYNCSALSAINIPNSVTSIGANAFTNCSNLQTVTVNWMEPLPIEQSVFNRINSNCKLIVPFGTKAKYMAANVWKDFYIEEMESSNIDVINSELLVISPNPVKDSFTITGINDSAKCSIYSSTGQKVLEKHISDKELISIDNLSKGIYIIVIENEEKTINRKIIKE